MAIPRSIQQQVRERADGICEYCHLPEAFTNLPFQIDHIIAEKQGGLTSLENLVYCCLYCNAFKGPNIAGVNQETQEVVRLFHPRQDTWQDHFTWNGARLVGRTAIGQVTIAVLAINAPYRAAATLIRLTRRVGRGKNLLDLYRCRVVCGARSFLGRSPLGIKYPVMIL